MGIFSQLLDKLKGEKRIPGKLYPEYSWRISIMNGVLYSIDWNGNERTINLNEINRFYVKTTDTGPAQCDVWWGIQTEADQIEIPQGCNGEDDLIKFVYTLPGFKLKGMNSTDNTEFECWTKTK